MRDSATPARPDAQELEKRYADLFSPADPMFDRLKELRERRLLRDERLVVTRTFVTYGAYEEPI